MHRARILTTSRSIRPVIAFGCLLGECLPDERRPRTTYQSSGLPGLVQARHGRDLRDSFDGIRCFPASDGTSTARLGSMRRRRLAWLVAVTTVGAPPAERRTCKVDRGQHQSRPIRLSKQISVRQLWMRSGGDLPSTRLPLASSNDRRLRQRICSRSLAPKVCCKWTMERGS